MFNLYVFRHGQSVYQCLRVISGIHEYGLSALGKYQTYMLASNTDIEFDAAYISDTKRTIETFEILRLAGRMPSPNNCVITPFIREKDQGIYYMCDFKDYPDDPNNREFTPQNGESWNDVQLRVSQMIQFLIARYLFEQKIAQPNDSEEIKNLYLQSENIQSKHNNIILVTHYGIIKEIVYFLKKTSEHFQLDQPYFAQNATLFSLQFSKRDNLNWDCKVISLNSYTRQCRPFMNL